MSDKTPITDKATFDLQIRGDAYHERVEYTDGSGDYVDADKARELETLAGEQNAAIEKAAMVLSGHSMTKLELTGALVALRAALARFGAMREGLNKP